MNQPPYDWETDKSLAPPKNSSYRRIGTTHEPHYHLDQNGLLHRCITWGRIALVVVVTDVVCEYLTFLPIHRSFEWMGLIH